MPIIKMGKLFIDSFKHRWIFSILKIVHSAFHQVGERKWKNQHNLYIVHNFLEDKSGVMVISWREGA